MKASLFSRDHAPWRGIFFAPIRKLKRQGRPQSRSNTVGTGNSPCLVQSRYRRSCQKATAEAAATLRESTECDMGMRATQSAPAITRLLSPSPSVPRIRPRRGKAASTGESIATESSRRAMATDAMPRLRRSAMGSSIQAHGTRNTEPIDTRIDRRLSGSQLWRVSSTASTPRAAAERNMAPMLVVSVTASITATSLAPAVTSDAGRGVGRRMAQSTPRVRVQPVRLPSVSRSAVQTGMSGQAAMMSAASPAICRRSHIRATGRNPCCNATCITFGLSTMMRASSGLTSLRSCRSVREANMAISGALMSDISIIIMLQGRVLMTARLWLRPRWARGR